MREAPDRRDDFALVLESHLPVTIDEAHLEKISHTIAPALNKHVNGM